MCSSGLRLLFVALLIASASSEALQIAAPPPDAPSASATAVKKTPRRPFDFKLLMKRSKVFPDLARDDEPLTPGQKWKLSVNESLSLAAIGGAVFSAGLSQARNALPGYGQGAEGYGKRFGAAMATSSSTQFFGTFLFASAFGQDPRFFVRANSGIRESVRYALRRVVITRTDQGGEVVNTSGLIGPLAAQTLANTYLPDSERTAGRTFQRYGTYVALRAGVNLAKQCWPSVFKGLMKGRRKKKPAVVDEGKSSQHWRRSMTADPAPCTAC